MRAVAALAPRSAEGADIDGPIADADDARTVFGGPESTARPRADCSPAARLTDDPVVISSSHSTVGMGRRSQAK